MFDSNLFGILVGGFLTSIGATWTLALWLTSKFAEIKRLVFEKIDDTQREVLDKLAYHERHDDSRFSQIQDAITDLRIRNAAAESLLVLREKTREKERESIG